MKKIYLLLTLLISATLGFSQTLVSPNGQVGDSGNGNVGIGLSSPESKLHVIGSFQQSGTEVFFDNGNKINLVRNGYYNSGWKRLNSGFVEMLAMRDGGFRFYVGDNGGSESAITWSELFTIKNDGKVGIGTQNPIAALDINVMDYASSQEGGLNLSAFYNNVNRWTTQVGLKSTSGGSPRFAITTKIKDAANVEASNIEALSIHLSTGNVGIGISNPTEKLQVAGTVYSTEVKVDIDAGEGPDYVFEPDYELRTLEATKEYIAKNRHLPEIPSAKEMEKDGVDLGDMNMLLLKKVEELTLHLIEQNEQNQTQQAEIEDLKKKIGQLEGK